MYFVNVIINQTHDKNDIAEAIFEEFKVPLTENANEFYVTENSIGVYTETVDETFVHNLANNLFEMGYTDFDIDVEDDFENINEITLEDDEDFHEYFGYLGFVEDEGVWEAEYQGRKVKLNKPMAGDVKKFKVYVKNASGNVVKVNFGQKGAKIKKSNPDRRRSFRARHNCDNPGPKWKARYWSCRKW